MIEESELQSDEEVEDDFEANDNLLYTTLTKSYPKLFAEVLERGYSLVLPLSDSLPPTLTLAFVKHHILCPSKLFRDQFTVIGNEDAGVENRQNKYLITIGSGWTYHCKVKVLRRDTFYTSDCKPYEVLIVQRHLLSGGDQLMESSKLPVAARLQFPKTAGEAVALLDRLKAPRDEITKQVDTFLRSYVIVLGCEEDLIRQVRKLVEACIVKTESCELPITRSTKNMETLSCAVSEYVTSLLQPRLWPHWCTLHREGDLKFIRYCEALASLPPHQLAAFPLVDQLADPPRDLSQSVLHLKAFEAADGPLEKMTSVKKCMDAIGEAFPPLTRRSMCADDILPVLAYVIAISQIPNFTAHHDFMSSFAPSAVLHTELGYVCASLQAAIHLVQQEGLCHLKMAGQLHIIQNLTSDSIPHHPDSVSRDRKRQKEEEHHTSREGTALRRQLAAERQHAKPPQQHLKSDDEAKCSASQSLDSHAPQPVAAIRPNYIPTNSAKDSGDFLKSLLN